MEKCQGKIIHDTKKAAKSSMRSLVAARIEAPDDLLMHNLMVYPHQGHWHVGHSHKTPLQELLITVRRFQ